MEWFVELKAEASVFYFVFRVLHWFSLSFAFPFLTNIR